MMKNPMNGHRARTDDPFLLSYNATDLRIASEFLGNWLPFLSRGLCHHCNQTLSDRIRSLDPVVADADADAEPLKQEGNLTVSTPKNMDLNGSNDNGDMNLLGSWRDVADMNDTADTNSLGSWTDGANEWSETIADASMSKMVGSSAPVESHRGSWKDGANECSESIVDASTSKMVGSLAPVESLRVWMSWADMAQEDELEADEENEVSRQLVNGNAPSEEVTEVVKGTPRTELSREQREYIRFSNVKREKDFNCLERVKGKIMNILDGLELHTHVFSAAEQKRIVDFVYVLHEMGKNGKLKERTYSAPQKWMRGKGRVTIQFGCCYNYATDRNGNPPGILQNGLVDPIPHLFKVIIRRLVRWHVLPPTCVPDSCIVNIYEEGDCIPPHIDNHDFVRPFCTVSFLSECNIVFGSNLKVVDAGEFAGCIAIPLPVGSVLVLNGNGADVAKHCVPAVPTKRISITFRKMDVSKWPIGFVPEPDLQGLQPLSYEADRSNRLNVSQPKRSMNRQTVRREDNTNKMRGKADRGVGNRSLGRIQQGPVNRQRVWVNLEN